MRYIPIELSMRHLLQRGRRAVKSQPRLVLHSSVGVNFLRGNRELEFLLSIHGTLSYLACPWQGVGRTQKRHSWKIKNYYFR